MLSEDRLIDLIILCGIIIMFLINSIRLDKLRDKITELEEKNK